MTYDFEIFMTALPTPLFENNERVLCFHGPLIYEGKTLKTQWKEAANEHEYLIHYAGWSKNWDEWVLESRVLKFSDANLERQKELKQLQAEQSGTGRKSLGAKTGSHKKKSTAAGSDSASVVSASDSRCSTPVMDQNQKGAKTGKRESMSAKTVGPLPVNESEDEKKRRKKSECVETEETYHLKQEIQISLPEQIKTYLVDDWDNVVRQRRLVKLPAQHSVEQILENYLKTRKKTDMHAVELCNGLREYFNCMIGHQLLYKNEREQYFEICKTYQNTDPPQKQMSEVYGVTHLMRLFTKLGVCLAYTSMDTEAVDLLQQCIDEFLKFLIKNYDDYFLVEEYTVSDPEYQRPVAV